MIYTSPHQDEGLSKGRVERKNRRSTSPVPPATSAVTKKKDVSPSPVHTLSTRRAFVLYWAHTSRNEIVTPYIEQACSTRRLGCQCASTTQPCGQLQTHPRPEYLALSCRSRNADLGRKSVSHDSTYRSSYTCMYGAYEDSTSNENIQNSAKPGFTSGFCDSTIDTTFCNYLGPTDTMDSLRTYETGSMGSAQQG